MARMSRAVIIGSGNVAEAFARALPGSGVEVVQIFARNAERGRELASLAHCTTANDPSAIACADIYIAAVSDRAVAGVLQPLELPEKAVVVHVSGAQPMSVIPEKFARRGVLYPLQTFTAGRRVDFSEIPMFVEGTDCETTQYIKEFASALSKNVRCCDSAQRARIHLAGVFACNFVNAMYSAGNRVAASADMPFDILKPLLAETARKAAGSPNPDLVQTGPAVRGDGSSMERHLRLLADDGSEAAQRLARIYREISDYIIYGKEL